MILVTGAAGTSGSAVIREFARHEVPVRALVRSLTKAYSLASLPNVELIEARGCQSPTDDVCRIRPPTYWCFAVRKGRRVGALSRESLTIGDMVEILGRALHTAD